MAEDRIREQELIRHEERVHRNVEHQQAINLDEKHRAIEVADQNAAVARIVSIVYFLFGALEVLLAVRVILFLVGANMENTFARFVDDLSSPFLVLFANLFQNPTVGTTGVLEVTTLIAMLVYAILAWLAGQFIWLILGRLR